MNFAHAEVATLDPTTMRTLCEEYIACLLYTSDAADE